MDVDFSIIIPVYKVNEVFLKKCLESTLNQNYDKYEVIVIDDGSPDNCGAICDDYSKHYDKIKVIHQKNQGVSVARNVGIENANGKWILFVDGDDWISSDTLFELNNVISSLLNNVDIVMFEYRREYSNSKFSHEKIGINRGILNENDLSSIKKAPFHKLFINNKEQNYSVIGVCTKLYNKDFLLKNNMSFIPEARKGQDRLFNAEALNLAKKIYYLDKCFFHYNSYMESVTNRYNENIVNLTILEVSSLRNLINKYNFDRIYNDYLNARICTRFYSMLRLYYFNELNNKKYKEVKREIKRVLCSEPFKSAFKNVKWKFLNFKEKVFVFSLKMRLIRFSKFLVNKKVKETSKIIK